MSAPLLPDIRKLNRRQVLTWGAAMLATGCGRRGRPLSAADTHPAGYPTVEAVRFFGQRLEQLSGGELSLNLYPGSQLGQERDSTEITIFGGIDFNRINLAPLNSIAPLTRVPALPFLFRSQAHMRTAMDGPAGDQILESLRAFGLVGLCFFDSGARSFYNTQRPIHTPADMAGMKIRVQNSPIYVQMINALGASATPMPFGEVYQGLVQGVIDGAENNWPSYESTRHFEVARYYSRTLHVMAPEVLVVSAKTWAGFSVSEKDWIRQAARESVGEMRRLWDARVESARQNVLAQGIEVIEDIDKREFARHMQPVWEPILADSRSRELVETIEAIDDENA